MLKKLFIIGLIFLLILGTVTATTSINPVAYYNFDETSGNLIDQTANGNDGVNTSIVDEQVGLIDYSYLYQGRSPASYSVLGNTNFSTSAMSVSFWFKGTVQGAGENGYFYSQGTAGADSFVMWSWDNSTNAGLTCAIREGSTSGISQGNEDFLDGNWNFGVCTYDGANMRLYVNNVEVASKAKTGAINTTLPTISARSWEFSNTNVKGEWDEMAIWAGKLTVDDINFLYNAGLDGNSYPFVPLDEVDANYSYVINQEEAKLILTDTSTTSGSTEIDYWTYLLDDTNIGYTADFNYPVVEYTDYNIGLRVDTNNGLNDFQYYTINSGDWTAPVTTLTDNGQVSGTTNYSIDLNCVDNNNNCEYINFSIDGGDYNYYAIGIIPLNIIISGGGDHNINYYSSDTNDNNEPINYYDFTTYGYGQLTFYDENSLALLNDIIYTISPSINGDSGATLTDSNVLDLNFTGITSQQYTFTFTLTDYGTRYYTTDLNEYSVLDKDFMLLPDGLQSDIDFKFFMPDRSTTVANTYITVQNWGKDNNYMERKLTDASGNISFNLNVLDGNYHFLFDSYDYNSIALTVNRPKSEETAVDIPETWDLTLSGLAAASFQDISDNSQLLAIYSNTVDYYILTVSSDSNDPVYLSRKYEMQTTGNPSTLTLQPYLPESDVATAIKIITEQDNGITVTRYPQVTVKIYKTLAEEGRSLIEQTITDAKGEAFVSLVAGDTYEFEVYVDGTIIEFYGDTVQLLKVAGSQIVFTINVAQSGASTTDISGVKVSYTPITTGLTLQTSGTKTFTQTITNLNNDAMSASVWYYMNGVLIESDFVLGISSDYTFSADFNWLDLEKGDLNIVVSVTWDGNTYYYSKTYTIATPFGGYYDPIEGLRTGLRSDLACTATGICGPLLAIALILSTGIVVFASIKIGALGTQATAILFGVFLTIFTYLTWVPIELIIVTWVLIFAFIITDRRGS